RHVSLGQRPGSWMAVALDLPGPTTTDDVEQAWRAVIARHGTLSTVFNAKPNASGTPTLVLNAVEVNGAQWTAHQVPAAVSSAQVLRAVFDAGCQPFARPAYLLVAAGLDRSRPRVVIGLDHSHADAWSLRVLARDLHVCLADVAAARVPGARLPPAAPFAQHSAMMETMPAAPAQVHRRWDEILSAGNGLMPTFPMPLGDLRCPAPQVVEIRDIFTADELARYEERLRTKGLRMLPAVISVMTSIFADLAGQPLRAVLPVHSRHEQRWHDSVGWFITNAVLESRDADPAACAVALKEALQLGSHPLAPIMAPYGGMPSGPGMFALSWMDNRRLPIRVGPDLSLQHVSAVIETDGVMIWFVVSEAGLHLRCRYPDTSPARASVSYWLDVLCAELANRAN
ncbi:MAG: peptide synthetase, partial [Ornithinimicrobium sp.]